MRVLQLSELISVTGGTGTSTASGSSPGNSPATIVCDDGKVPTLVSGTMTVEVGGVPVEVTGTFATCTPPPPPPPPPKKKAG